MQTRREMIARSAAVAAALASAGLLPAHAQAAWNKGAFEAKNVDDVLKALGVAKPVESKDVTLTAPDIAENGAVVPIGITSKVPRTSSIAILIEKNPNTLAAVFDIPPGTDPSLSTRVKMAQTSNVFALVKAEGRYYVASKEIKVTLGGCGG
jgi:sulfur-oxidizing protein SoxY